MAAAVRARLRRRNVALAEPRCRGALRLLTASPEPRTPAAAPREEPATDPAAQLFLPSSSPCGAVASLPLLAASLVALRVCAEDAERTERERALAKLPGASPADVRILEQLGARLVDGLAAYLAARTAALCAAEPGSGAVLVRFFAPQGS